jgi:hypothetical protein
MKRHKIRLNVDHIIVKLVITLSFFLAFYTIGRIAEKTVFTEISYPLYSSGQAVIGNSITGRLTGKSKTAAYYDSILEFPQNCNLIQTKKEYDIRSDKDKSINQKINSDYPLFVGAYLYLYHNNFLMLKDDFTILRSSPDTYLNDGVLFNQKKQSEKKIKVILIKLPNGLYINNQKLLLKNGDSADTIKANSIIRFQETGITYCSINDRDIDVKDLSVTHSTAILSFGNKSISYDALYEKLNAGAKEKKEPSLDAVTIKDDLYQYFLGSRYEYPGTKTFYRSDDGYVMQTKDNRVMLTSAPLYFSGETKILMPSDYVLIQPKLFKMNKMPAMTELIYKKGVVYTSCGKTKDAFKDITLFDGQDTYLFFNKVQISWDKGKVSYRRAQALRSVRTAALNYTIMIRTKAGFIR